jgi:hypothetical protein
LGGYLFSVPESETGLDQAISRSAEALQELEGIHLHR